MKLKLRSLSQFYSSIAVAIIVVITYCFICYYYINSNLSFFDLFQIYFILPLIVWAFIYLAMIEFLLLQGTRYPIRVGSNWWPYYGKYWAGFHNLCDPDNPNVLLYYDGPRAFIVNYKDYKCVAWQVDEDDDAWYFIAIVDFDGLLNMENTTIGHLISRYNNFYCIKMCLKSEGYLVYGPFSMIDFDPDYITDALRFRPILQR